MNKIPGLKVLIGTLAWAASAFVHSEPGIKGDVLTIGQSVDLSGPASSVARDIVDGLRAAFEEANSSGRVPGKRVVLSTKDDSFEPSRTGENTAEFQRKGTAFALVAPLGAQQTTEMLNALMAGPIPLLCPFTGGDTVRGHDRNVFHLRASYRDEARAIVDQLVTTGLKRISLLFQDDSLGREGLAHVQEALKRHGLQVLTAVPFRRDSQNIDRVVADSVHERPDAIIAFAVGNSVVEFVKALRASGGSQQIITISTNSHEGFSKSLGGLARGIGTTQVVPSPWNRGIPVVRSYQDAMYKMGRTEFSPLSLEGFLCGKLVIEGLQRSSPNPTREKFVQAIESLGAFDFGGFEVRYSTKNHFGSSYVGMSVFGANGKIIY